MDPVLPEESAPYYFPSLRLYCNTSMKIQYVYCYSWIPLDLSSEKHKCLNKYIKYA